MGSGEGIVEEGIGRGGGADEPPGMRRSNGTSLEVVVAVGKSMRGEEWGRGARVRDEAGGGGEAEANLRVFTRGHVLRVLEDSAVHDRKRLTW